MKLPWNLITFLFLILFNTKIKLNVLTIMVNNTKGTRAIHWLLPHANPRLSSEPFINLRTNSRFCLFLLPYQLATPRPLASQGYAAKNDLTCLMVRLDPHGWIDICPHEHKCQLHKTCKLLFLYCLVTCHVHMDSFHPHGTFHWQKIWNWEKISYTVTQELNWITQVVQ